MPKQQVKCSQIHFRCEDKVRDDLADYVEAYNDKYGHIQKTNMTEVIEQAIQFYITQNAESIPMINRGQPLW